MNCQWMFRYGVCKPQWVTKNFQIWFLISWQHKGQSIWRHVMKSLLTSIFFSQWSMNLNMITGISATVLTLLGKFCITFAFAAIYIYTCEWFPTTIRNLGLGLCSLCGRIGSALAPIIISLVRHNNSFHSVSWFTHRGRVTKNGVSKLGHC